MEFNWFAIFILICITIYILYDKTFRYIDAFVFFITFNATAVFFTPSGTAINLPFTLFFFAAISFFLNMLLKPNYKIKRNRVTSYSWLLIIAIIAIISQIMPFIINGKYETLERYKETVYWAKEVPLYPSMQWITQTLYFIIGLFVVFVISSTYKTKDEISKLLKLLISGITFMIFWGWIAEMTFFLDLPYPQLFNQLGMWEFGLETEAFNGFPRMASVTMEPSYLAQIVIPITPFFYWLSQQERSLVFNKIFHKRMYVFSLITLLLAITTTGVLGFFLLIGLLLINNIRFFTKRSKYFLVITYTLLVAFGVFLMVDYLISVSGTYSGIERFKTVIYGIKYVNDYPILGVGWGVFPTYDFIINLLAGFGIIGTIPFLIFLYNIYFKIKINIRISDHEMKPLYRAGLESFFLILIVSQLSGFIYHSQYFWVYIGLSISIGYLNNKRNLI